MKTHKDLVAWQRSISFVTEIYKVTRNFPNDEMYGLISQLRRASISIPLNIAEGAARDSKKDFIRFLHISLGSASELETQIAICENLNYLKSELSRDLQTKLADIRRTLIGLISSLKD